MKKTDDEWREVLSPEAFAVCRKKATERPFTGKLLEVKDPGTYRCTCCGQTLFESGTKFESGSGWPSFFAPATEGGVRTEVDRSHGMTRVEVLCSSCDAHLGHLFDDGPAPTGKRYCINSVSLEFDPSSES